MDKFYRASLILEEIEESESPGASREIAEITVTGGTPGAAMSQMRDHAEQLLGWHRDPIQLPPVDVLAQQQAARDAEALLREATDDGKPPRCTHRGTATGRRCQLEPGHGGGHVYVRAATDAQV